MFDVTDWSCSAAVGVSFVVVALVVLVKWIHNWLLAPPLQFEWDNGADGLDYPRRRIDTFDVHFPKNFLWGTATAAYQIEGGCDNTNWHAWESMPGPKGGGSIRNGDRAGRACDHWNMLHEDVDLMKELGVNSYRFSIEWSKLQPNPGEWNVEAARHYHQEIDLLLDNGITPMITLHHFTHPLWFEELGSFEKTENIPHFVEFATKVVSEYGKKVPYWCTFNEPEMFAAGGWFAGNFPPGKKDPGMAGVVLRNIMDAHVRTYQAIKALPMGPQVRVGLVKDIFQFEPWNRWNPMDWVLAWGLEWAMNGAIIEFCRSGKFSWSFFGTNRVLYECASGPKSHDFVGLNYYSHYCTRFRPFNKDLKVELTHAENSLMTDMSYPLYPEGLYRAIETLSVLKVPIIITECGVADQLDDRRELFIRRYLWTLSKAIRDGYDVRGFFYWTLMDNFEWAEGYEMRFGLYETDFGTLKRTLRHGARYYQRVVHKFANKHRVDE